MGRDDEKERLPPSPGFLALQRKYLDSFPEKMATLRAARAREDCDTVIALLHQLAGSSGSYGFPELSRRCLALEEEIICAKESLVRAKSMLEELLELMQAIYQQHLDQHGKVP